MAYSGCEKRFKIPQYIQRVDELVDAVKRNETSYKSNPGKFEIGRDDLLPKAVPEKEDKEENQKPLKKQKHEKKK